MNALQKTFGLLLLPGLTFFLGFSLAGRFESDPQTSRNIADRSLQEVPSDFKDLDLTGLDEILRKIDEKYVDPTKVDPLKIVEGIMRGAVSSLGDQYSTYLSAAESQDFDEELAGELNGIGAELTMKDDMVMVVSPLKDAPAAAAGILPEDVILRVNGEEIKGQNLGAIVGKIRGPEGTKVQLTILRPSTSELIEKEVMRKHILVESATLAMQGDIALIEVRRFGDRTEAEFTAHLREAIVKNPQGIILDLRYNPGGYLQTAVEMVSAFVREGKVVMQKERDPNVINKFVTGKVLTDLPVVVLINKGSASAAEIVAGALQDHERAIVIGEQSFGKGTVQELVPLSSGGNLRLTVARWLTPNGRDIGEKGITPDIIITRTPEDFAAGKDPQMEAAMKFLKGEVKREDFANNTPA